MCAHQETHTQSANLELGKKRLAQLTRQNRIRHLANVMISTEKDALEEIRQGFTA